MLIKYLRDIMDTDKEVRCPDNGFTSYRYLLESDNMGFSLTRTFIPIGKEQIWHYKNHLEACYCISGMGTLTNLGNGEKFKIYPGVMYALDKNDKHSFQAIKPVELICIFNPPLKCNEIHNGERSYDI
jgi:L-ectoine synthase